MGGSGRDFLTGGYGTDTFSFWAGHSGYSTNLSNADVIFDFNKQEGDKIDLSLANVSYFGGVDSLPEPNEVSYWFRNNVTVVSFHDGEAINDVVLFGTPRLNMVESDFIV